MTSQIRGRAHNWIPVSSRAFSLSVEAGETEREWPLLSSDEEQERLRVEFKILEFSRFLLLQLLPETVAARTGCFELAASAAERQVQVVKNSGQEFFSWNERAKTNYMRRAR